MKVKTCSAHGCRRGVARGNAEAWADVYKGPRCVIEWSISQERPGMLSLRVCLADRAISAVLGHQPHDLGKGIYLILFCCSVLFWKWQVLRRQVFKPQNVSIEWCSSARSERVGLSGGSLCEPDNYGGKIILKCCFPGVLVVLKTEGPTQGPSEQAVLIPKADMEGETGREGNY